jgi:GntR family transcriptional repressor for pyruvate dehydrogenase complex
MRNAGGGAGTLGPLRRRNLSQEIAEALTQEIASGRLKPGERLGSERALCETFAVSRSSVREAIKTLQSHGLVESRPGGGTFVSRQGLDTLVRVPSGPTSITEAEVHYLFEVREMLEPGIARLAAERARPADIAALTRLLERQERFIEAGRYTSAHDARFHEHLARISGNPVLMRLEEGVMRLLGAAREPALRAASDAGVRFRLDRHWAILRAIAVHDADAAAACSLDHLRHARATAIRAVRAQDGVGE